MGDTAPDAIAAEGIISDLQDAVRAHLRADTWLSDISVFTPDDLSQDGAAKTPADIEQRIAQALSPMDKGICIIVALPVLASFAPDAPELYSDEVPMLIRIVENPLVNRSTKGTRRTATMTAIRIMRDLHHFAYRGCILRAKSAKRVPDNDALIWDVQFTTAINIPSLEP